MEERVQYKAKAYRLQDEVIAKIKEARDKENISFNQLFNKLIELYGKE